MRIAAFKVLANDFIGYGTPESIALGEALVVYIPEFPVMRVQQSVQRGVLRAPGSVFFRKYAANAHLSPPGEG